MSIPQTTDTPVDYDERYSARIAELAYAMPPVYLSTALELMECLVTCGTMAQAVFEKRAQPEHVLQLLAIYMQRLPSHAESQDKPEPSTIEHAGLIWNKTRDGKGWSTRSDGCHVATSPAFNGKGWNWTHNHRIGWVAAELPTPQQAMSAALADLESRRGK